MSWSPLLVVAILTLLAASLLILVIERWDRFGPLFRRWGWLFYGAAALANAIVTLDATAAGRDNVLLQAALAAMFFWFAVSEFRRTRGRGAGDAPR